VNLKRTLKKKPIDELGKLVIPIEMDNQREVMVQERAMISDPAIKRNMTKTMLVSSGTIKEFYYGRLDTK